MNKHTLTEKYVWICSVRSQQPNIIWSYDEQQILPFTSNEGNEVNGNIFTKGL